jgi:uncharacterized protein (TIGR02996 family)
MTKGADGVPFVICHLGFVIPCSLVGHWWVIGHYPGWVMSERDALLAAILATPGDDTVRLAFADWCDENGEADRAEFIRLQIHLAHPAEAGSEANTLLRFVQNRDAIVWDRLNPELAARASMDRRAKSLLHTHKAQWFGHSRALNQLAEGTRRGFPGWVTLHSSNQVRSWLETFRTVPVTGMDVRHASLEVATELIRSGILSGLSSLALQMSDETDAVEVVRLVGTSGQVSGVTSLMVTCRETDPAPMVQAVSEGGWGEVRQLSLGFWPHMEVWFPRELVQVMTAAPALRRITELTLQAEVDVATAVDLATAYPKLELLAIRRLTPQAAHCLSQLDLPELRSLSVRLTEAANVAQEMYTQVIGTLLTTAKFPKLAVFPTGDHHQGLTGLRKYLNNPDHEPTLRHIDLRYSQLGPGAAEAMTYYPAFRGLIFLKLEGNPIGSEGAAALAATNWCGLADLDLHSCSITATGAAALASSALLELQRLDLSFNPIGSMGCRALARGHFPHLWHLNVQNCGADDEAKSELRRRFGKLVRV